MAQVTHSPHGPHFPPPLKGGVGSFGEDGTHKWGVLGSYGEAEHLAAMERESASLKRQILTLARLAGAALARLEPEERAACLLEAQEVRT